VPTGSDLRPTSEKTRQAIFSSLGGDIIDANIADLFCGTGALGIEALSQGAGSALFIDESQKTINTLKSNIENLDLADSASVVKMDVLRIKSSYFEKISIIFTDPPYRKGYCDKLLSLLSLPKFDWHGIIVAEHESQWVADGEKYNLINRLQFGDTAVSFIVL